MRGRVIPAPASSRRKKNSFRWPALPTSRQARSAELRDEMKRASQETANDPARMRAAEQEGFAPRSTTSCVRPNGNVSAKKAERTGKDEELER